MTRMNNLGVQPSKIADWEIVALHLLIIGDFSFCQAFSPSLLLQDTQALTAVQSHLMIQKKAFTRIDDIVIGVLGSENASRY